METFMVHHWNFFFCLFFFFFLLNLCFISGMIDYFFYSFWTEKLGCIVGAWNFTNTNELNQYKSTYLQNNGCFSLSQHAMKLYRIHNTIWSQARVNTNLRKNSSQIYHFIIEHGAREEMQYIRSSLHLVYKKNPGYIKLRSSWVGS